MKNPNIFTIYSSQAMAWECSTQGLMIDGTTLFWVAGSMVSGPKPALNSIDKFAVQGVPTVTPILMSGNWYPTVAVDNGEVFFTNGDGLVGTLWRMATDGTGVTQLTSMTAGFGPMRVDATYVYALGACGSTPNMCLVRVPRTGGAVDVLVPNLQTVGGEQWVDLTLDGTNIYVWMTLGTIWRVPLVNGTPTVVVESGDWPVVTIDSTSLYWTQGGRIMRRTPK